MSTNYSDINTYQPTDIPIFQRPLTRVGYNTAEFVSSWGLGNVVFERLKMCANFRQIAIKNKPTNQT